MVPYFLANYKTKKLSEGGWQVREGGKYCTRLPCGNRECRDGPWRAWWLHFNGQIKNQCPMGRCTYFVLKLSKRNCIKINEKRIRKKLSIEHRSWEWKWRQCRLATGVGRRSLNPINLHKLVTFRVQQLLVNIWSRCRRLCPSRDKRRPDDEASPQNKPKNLLLPAD